VTDTPYQGTITDKYGAEWNVRKAPSGNYTASLVQPAYDTGPGSDVIAASSLEALVVEANGYADDFIKSGGKPPQRASATVSTKADNGAWILLLIAAFALLKGKRR
jgi:hypothetical protein